MSNDDAMDDHVGSHAKCGHLGQATHMRPAEAGSELARSDADGPSLAAGNKSPTMLEVVHPHAPTARQPLRASLAGSRLMASAFLSPAERKALEDAVLGARSIRVGMDLVREDADTDQVYFVVEGWFCRYKTTASGGRQIVAFALPGDLANLDAALSPRSSCGVRALTPATVVSIARARLLELQAELPGIAQSIAGIALVENAILSQWALCLGRQTAQQRLAHLLCEMHARATIGGEHPGSSFQLPLTQEQLADALGLTTVHVNRTVQSLRSAGLFTNTGRLVNLPDVARLRALAEFDPSYLHIGTDDGRAVNRRIAAIR